MYVGCEIRSIKFTTFLLSFVSREVPQNETSVKITIAIVYLSMHSINRHWDHDRIISLLEI